MDVTPLLPGDRQVVESYGGGRFRVSGTLYEGSVLVLPERTRAWPVTALAEVTLESLAPLFAEESKAIAVLLLGCGPKMAMMPAALRDGLRQHGIALEPMDTGAACRTYNVLLAEERRVGAALIAVA